MILVAGATGNLGSEICRRLLSRGETVRGLARATSSPEKIAALETIGVEIVRGDLKNRASLDAACRGVDTVISTVSMIVTAKEGDSFDETDNAGTRALVEAARAANARQFIFVSFDWSIFPDSPLVKAKREVEQHLKQSGLSYTILQPTPFMETWLGPVIGLDVVAGSAHVLGTGESRINYVALSDVAELAVQCVDNPAARNATIPIGGPEVLRQRDAIGVFEEVYGKPFTVTAIPDEALGAQYAGAEDPFARSFAALMLGAARGAVADNAAVETNFPKLRLTSVREYVERQAGRQPAEPRLVTTDRAHDRNIDATP